MAIDKLNFSGINSGSENNLISKKTIGDRLMEYGANLNEQENAREKIRLLEEDRAYQRGRDALQDSRYDADKKLQAEEKARLLGKEYNTSRAALALTDPNALKKEALSGEQRAIEATLANASPEDRLQIQQELKGYNPAESGKQWVDTALSQSNVDAGMITNLKRDIVKQEADEKYKNESLALQKRQNEIASQARADSLQYNKDRLQLERDQLKAPKKTNMQQEYEYYKSQFGEDAANKKYGPQTDETKKKEYAVGGFKNDFIVEKAGEGLGTWTDSGAQENAAKTRTTLENMQRAMQLPNSEMERIIPLIVGTGGEINKDALDTIYGNKIALDQSGNIIKMSDAFTKIANNPKDFITVTNEGKTQLLPVQSDAAKKLITNMGAEAMDYYGIKPSEPEKDAVAKRLETLTKNDESKIVDPNVRKNIFGGELAPGGKQFNEMIYDKIRGGTLDESWKIVTNPGYFANKSNEEKNRILSGLGEIVLSTPLLSDQEIRKDIKQNSPFIGNVIYNQ